MAAMAHARRRPQVRLFFHKNHRGLDATEMPIEYLLEIEHAPFPLRVKQPDAIRSIAVLKAVGLVEADIYPPLDLRARFGDYQLAVVSGITPQGRAELGKEWAETGEPAGPHH
jgi:hypothetical protein